MLEEHKEAVIKITTDALKAEREAEKLLKKTERIKEAEKQ